MEIQQIIDQKKEYYNPLLIFLESNIDDESLIFKDFDEKGFKEILYLISKIAKNHHQNAGFFSKIEKFLLYFEDKIKQTFSNSEIFNFFKSNKKILLFLFEKKIITIDESIINYMFEKSDKDYPTFFWPEIESFENHNYINKVKSQLSKLDSSAFDNFELKRKIGENDLYVCSLIRDDSIEEFVKYVTQTNMSLSKTIIKHSIFETNSFLINKKATLIEYAAFFGSFQIFKFLQLNGVKLEKSLWLYAIHSDNSDLIHLMEESGIAPEDSSFECCLKESIKCHHNCIANYIHEHFINEKDEKNKIEKDFNKNIFAYAFHYFNYKFFPDDFNNKFDIFYLIQNDYFAIVNALLKTKDIDLSIKYIYKKNFNEVYFFT